MYDRRDQKCTCGVQSGVISLSFVHSTLKYPPGVYQKPTRFMNNKKNVYSIPLLMTCLWYKGGKAPVVYTPIIIESFFDKVASKTFVKLGKDCHPISNKHLVNTKVEEIFFT